MCSTIPSQATLRGSPYVLALTPAGAQASSVEAPTYEQHVAPLLAARCAGCHHPEGSAPFSLLTYEDVRPRASQLAAAIARRTMPPWLPEQGAGEFIGERRLSRDEIALFQRWVETGAVRGVPRAPAARPANPEWKLGRPDLIVSMPAPYSLAADGPDVFRNFVLPLTIPTTKYVTAWEFQPGNPKVVYHATMVIDSTRSARQLDAEDPAPGPSTSTACSRTPIIWRPPCAARRCFRMARCGR